MTSSFRRLRLHVAGCAVPAAAAMLLAAPAVGLAAGAVGPATPAGSAVYGIAATATGDAVAVGSAGGSMLVQRVNAAGQASPAFAAGAGTARAVGVQYDGKVVVAGDDSGFAVRRFGTDGAPDLTFGLLGTAKGAGKQANALALGDCGTVVAAGTIAGDDGFPRVSVSRFLTLGTLDPAFGSGGSVTVPLPRNSRARGVALQPDGKIIIVGDSAPGLQVVDAFIARLNADGSLDTSFASGGVFSYYHPGGGANSSFAAVTVTPAGAIVAAGRDVRDDGVFALFARLTTSGAPDSSFSGDGIATPDGSRNFFGGEAVGATGLVVAGGGEVVGTGAFQDSGQRSQALWALTPSGDLDPAVGTGGLVTTKPDGNGAQSNAISVAPDGTLLVGGETLNFSGDNTGLVRRYSGFGAPNRTAISTCGSTTTPPAATPPAQTAPTPTPTPPPPSAKPKVSKAKLRKSSITPKKSTLLVFTSATTAKITLTFDQQLRGRKTKAGKCAKVTRSNKKGKACTYTVNAGSKTITPKVGSNSVTLKVTTPGRKLKTGKYTLTLKVKGGNTVKLTLTVRAK